MKTFNELHPLVLQWGEERELFNPKHGATPLSQLRKFFEEFGELNQALNKKDREGIKDAIGDCQVCLINYAKLSGLDIKEDNLNDGFDLEITIDWYFRIIDHASNDNVGFAILELARMELAQGFKPWECLNFAYNEIKDRKGKMINRTFVKDN